ncbi:MAG TPA: creatininase family protein [Bryobacteraceae bacterium]|nr:creatininase family protein [Bryobacteraceae bacterium]
MTWPEVQDLLTRTDMVIIPIAAIEQHGPHAPIGTDFLAANERAKLIAQKTDVLVAPILLPGISPYHMDFPGTISLSEETVVRVYFEAAQSLIHHGFRRFLLLVGHAGDQYAAPYIADRINQETPATALILNQAVAPLLQNTDRGLTGTQSGELRYDAHAGVTETSIGLYLFPNLLDMSKAPKADLTLPDHLRKMLPQVVAGDPVARQIFLAEALKPRETGKQTSTREISATGVFGERDDVKEASAGRGRADVDAFTAASVQFIERWKNLEPLHRP